MMEQYLQYNHNGDAAYDLILDLDKTPEESVHLGTFLQEYTWAHTMTEVTGAGERAPHVYFPKLYIDGEYHGSLTDARDLTVFLSYEDYIILPPVRAMSGLQDFLLQFSNTYICPTRFNFIEPSKTTFLKELMNEGINLVGIVAPRSGLGAKHQITIANNIGVIDLKYRGNVMVALENRGRDIHMFTNGSRIAQLMIATVLDNPYNLPAVKDQTRETKGFGSSGGRLNHPADTSKRIYTAAMLDK